MSLTEVERTLRRIGAKPIDNSTQIGTFSVVEAEKFATKGINNRDNARWKRAQYIIVDYCPISNIQFCVRGFLQFAEGCQYLIISNTNQVFNGKGQPENISHITIRK